MPYTGIKRRRTWQEVQENKKRAILRRNRAILSTPGAYQRTMALRNLRTGGLLDKEIKYFDTTKTTVIINASPNVWTLVTPSSPISIGCLSAPSQGDGATNRDGKKIIIKRLDMNFELASIAALGTASPYASGMVRIIVYIDSQTNGTNSGIASEIVEDANGVVDFRNMAYTKRFKVIMDKNFHWHPTTMAVGNAATYSTATMIKKFSFHKEFKGGLPVQFTENTTADIANVVDNSIGVLAITENSAVQLGYRSRIRFIG